MANLTPRCCPTCARWYTPVQAVQVYCSSACRLYWDYRGPNERRRRERQKSRGFRCICLECGTEFRGKHGEVRFCSADCRWVNHEATHPRVTANQTAIRWVRCEWCDKSLATAPWSLKRFCSHACVRARSGAATPIAVRDCKRCGAPFIRHHLLTEWCSTACNKAERKRVRKHLARANGGEDISLREIAERDGWRCHLCGKQVPDQQYKARDADPTLDHLIPVTAGGQHTAINLALAHNRCNWERREHGAAQLRLIA